jgi:iron complex transport system substrate-binding protein
MSVGDWKLALLPILAGLLWWAVPPEARFVIGNRLATTEIRGETYPLQLIDPIGRAQELAAPPQRIVSGVLASDEMLADMVDLTRICAVTYLVDDRGISNVPDHYPAAIRRHRGQLEELLAMRPDLVVVTSHSQPSTVKLLLRAGVFVVRVPDANSFDAIAMNIEALGRVLGASKRAEALIDHMRRKLARVEGRVAGRQRPRVLYYSMGSTAGPDSLTDEMIQRAGGYNVIRDTGIRGYTRISPEMAIALQPEVVILSDWSKRSGSNAAETLRADPAWQQVPAVRTGQIHAVRGAWVTSGSQFRVEGVEILARLLHPEAFDDQDH